MAAGDHDEGLRLPIAPPEQPPPEDDGLVTLGPSAKDWGPSASPSEDGDARGMERLLEECMRRLECRLDRLPAEVAQWVLSRVSREPQRDLHEPQAYQYGRQEEQSPRRDMREPQPYGRQEERPQAPSAGQGAPEDNEPNTVPSSSSRRSVREWVGNRSSAVHQDVFNTRRMDTKERIASHWHLLEQMSTPGRKSALATRIVSHKWFDISITAIVVLSAVLVGIQIDYEAAGDLSKVNMFQYVEYACAGVFTIELALRLVAHGLGRLCGRSERAMFTLDVILVLISWIDIVMSMMYTMSHFGASASVGKIIKAVRVGRLMRMLRAVRFLSELRLMANMIFNSFRSLMWLFSILVFLAYSFALVLTQGATQVIRSPESDPTVAAGISRFYGSILLTMYSLFKCMTGGISWGEVSDTIQPAGEFYRLLVVLYVFINLFSVLNIVTGVFVDGAIELGKRDRVMMIQKQGKKREAFARHLVELLRDMDTSAEGVITKEEFLASFSRREVKEFMQALSIDLDDASNMFSLLDRNGDGTVDIVEFVMGMEKLRGEAKSSDIHFLIAQCGYITDLLKHQQGYSPQPPTLLPDNSARLSSKSSKPSEGRGAATTAIAPADVSVAEVAEGAQRGEAHP